MLTPRSRTTVVVLCMALTAGLGPLLGAGTAAAADRDPARVQAVVTYEPGAAVARVRGVEVVTPLPGVGAAVVRGTGPALARLARTPGVRGLAPDAPVQVNSIATAGSTSGGVLASDGLSGRAGRKGAGRGVRVAVVDTGVSDSAALDRASGRLVDAVDTSDVFEGGPVRTSGVFEDGYGHGTFMASLIAGREAPGSGGRAVGVAPRATVLAVKVAGDDGTTSLSEVVAGLDWIAAHPDRVDVANLALSARRPGEGYGADPLTDAVERVQRAGVVVVVSAGNRRGEVGDPGFDPRVLTVGAADVRTGAVTGFSGSAVVAGVRKPDVVASGRGVLGVLPPGSTVARGSRRAPATGELWRGSGTSQATAIASGAAALLLVRHPEATPAQVKATLRGGAVDLPGRRDGAGLLQTPTRLLGGPDGTAPDGTDLTGELTFDANSWSANSWSANSWSANSWSANSWSANSWSANSWSANSWSVSAP